MASQALINAAPIARAEFLDDIADLPPALRDSIRRCYTSRLQRAEGRPLLGEYAADLLADVVTLKSAAPPSLLRPAIMHIYVATLLTDDLLDDASDTSAAFVAAASALLVQRGLSRVVKLVPAVSPAQQLIDKYFLEAATAACDEIQRRKRGVFAFDEKDVSALASKGALLKLAAALMRMIDGEEPDPNELAVIDELLVGVQLLDDLTDWREDWAIGNFTFLLSVTITRLQELGLKRADIRDLTPEDIFAALVLTGALEETLKEASRRLRRVVASGHLKLDSPSHHLVDQVLRNNVKLIDQARRVADGASLRTSGSLQAAGVRRSLRDVGTSEELALLRSDLMVVAQES